MNRLIRFALAASPALLLACGSSYPPPTQPMAEVVAASRSAKALGAESVPDARLHLQLAEEQRNEAAKLMNDGENERARALLVRAKADAELAVALVHEQRAKAEVQEATAKAQKMNEPTMPGGAQ